MNTEEQNIAEKLEIFANELEHELNTDRGGIEQNPYLLSIKLETGNRVIGELVWDIPTDSYVFVENG